MSSMPPPPPAFAAAGSGSAPRADASVPDPDLGVIKTNDEASGAKACCVSRGYFDDPFVKHFARRVPKHPPLINRGYHARVATVRAVLDAFLDATFDADGLGASSPAATSPGDDRVAETRHENAFGKRRQIVSLGAGFDTSYFRLRTRLWRREDDEKHTRQPCSLTFVEIDHNAVVAEKAGIVNATPALREACVGGDGVRRMGEDEDGLLQKEKKNAFADGGGYVMCGCDLRDARALDAALSDTARLDPNVPTLFLSECCLAYLEAEEASEVLRFAASWGGREGEGKSLSLPDPPPLRAYFAYDPSLIGDANESEKNERARDRFGEQMLLNLRARGCPLLGAEKTRGVAKHVERARRNGWEIAGAVDMLAASKRLAYENPSESRRVAFIEPLDELEEYELIQAHYVVSWGVRGADDDAARLERVVDRSSARRP